MCYFHDLKVKQANFAKLFCFRGLGCRDLNLRGGLIRIAQKLARERRYAGVVAECHQAGMRVLNYTVGQQPYYVIWATQLHTLLYNILRM